MKKKISNILILTSSLLVTASPIYFLSGKNINKNNNIEQQSVEKNGANTAIDNWYVSKKVFDPNTFTMDFEITFYVTQTITEPVSYTLSYDDNDDKQGYYSNNSNYIEITNSTIEPGVYQYWISDVDVSQDMFSSDTTDNWDQYFIYFNMYVGSTLVNHYGPSHTVWNYKTEPYYASQTSSSIYIRGFRPGYITLEATTWSNPLGNNPSFNASGFAHYLFTEEYGLNGFSYDYLTPYSGFSSNGTYNTREYTTRDDKNEYLKQDTNGFIHMQFGSRGSNGYDIWAYSYFLHYHFSNDTAKLAIDDINVVSTNDDSITIEYDQNWESKDVWIYVGESTTPSNSEWKLVSGSNTNYQGIDKGAMNDKQYVVTGLEKNVTYNVKFAYGGTDQQFDGNGEEVVQLDTETFAISSEGEIEVIDYNIGSTKATITYEFKQGLDFVPGSVLTYAIYKGSTEVVAPTNLSTNDGVYTIENNSLTENTTYKIVFELNSKTISSKTFTTKTAEQLVEPVEDSSVIESDKITYTYHLHQDATSLEYSFRKEGEAETWVSVTDPTLLKAGTHTVTKDVEIESNTNYYMHTKVDGVVQQEVVIFNYNPSSYSLLWLWITLSVVGGVLIFSGATYTIIKVRKK